MKIKKTKRTDYHGIKFTVEEDGNVVGRAYLYVMRNDLHDEPFGLMEDVFVEEKNRSHGIGKKLVAEVIKEAKAIGCYKLIGQSRHSRTNVHEFYKEMGFNEHGLNFRMDFKK